MAAPNLKSLEQRFEKVAEAYARPEPRCMFQMANNNVYKMTTKQFFEACQFAIQGGENQYTHIILNAVRCSGIGRLPHLLKMVATEPQTANIPGERKLWCLVIRLGAIDARNGIPSAQRFFQSKNGVFAEICRELGLSATTISKRVLGTPGKQQARKWGSDIAPRKPRKAKATPLVTSLGAWTNDPSTISALSAWTQGHRNE